MSQENLTHLWKWCVLFNQLTATVDGCWCCTKVWNPHTVWASAFDLHTASGSSGVWPWTIRALNCSSHRRTSNKTLLWQFPAEILTPTAMSVQSRISTIKGRSGSKLHLVNMRQCCELSSLSFANKSVIANYCHGDGGERVTLCRQKGRAVKEQMSRCWDGRYEGETDGLQLAAILILKCRWNSIIENDIDVEVDIVLTRLGPENLVTGPRQHI